jgi:hypothetical protein
MAAQLLSTATQSHRTHRAGKKINNLTVVQRPQVAAYLSEQAAFL